MYDLIIIGGGPAGVSAGIYAVRKQLKTAVIADAFGGQSIVSDEIENWIGIKSISGLELAKRMEEHLRAQEGIEIYKDKVTEVIKQDETFVVKTAQNQEYEAKTVLVCSGSNHRRLGVVGEKKFIGKGVAFCSTCDAPLFRNKDVAVIGAGNVGLESVIDLASYANKIYLIARGDQIRGDQATYNNVSRCDKAQIIFNAEVKEILGDNFVHGLRYIDKTSGEEKEISINGVFVAIGMIPNSGIVKELVMLNEIGEIIVDPKNGKTSMEGIWAAGDVADTLYQQSNIAAGDAIRAVLNIDAYLSKSREIKK